MEPTPQEHRNTHHAPRFGLIAGTVALSFALGACENGVSATEYRLETTGVVSGTLDGGKIKAGSNIRFYPRRDGESPACAASIKKPIKIHDNTPVAMVSPETDGNGPWYGFDVASLATLPERCAHDDKTGVVWTVAKNVTSHFTETEPHD